METWEEARLNRLEDRVDRIERKEWERRDFVLRLILHGLTAAMVVLSIASVVLSIIRVAH